jgi:hypothetical protein
MADLAEPSEEGDGKKRASLELFNKGGRDEWDI